MAKTCPSCLLVSPESAGRCDCGFDFSLVSPAQVDWKLAKTESASLRKAVIMLVVGLLAVGVSALQIMTAHAGEGVVLPWGLAVFGLLAAGRAFTKYQDARLARRENRPR